MGFLDIMSRIVGIIGGIVGSLTGILTIAEKCKPYINRRKGQTKKDPSASFPASDGSSDDCVSSR